MHPSGLEDADWMPRRRPEENFGKYLKTRQFRNESESRRVDDEGRGVQHSGRDANTPTGVFLDGKLTWARTEKRKN
jgi:hypothetical protein